VAQEQSLSYRDVLSDDESLVTFLRNLKEFDDLFVNLMTMQREYSLKFEVHGNKGRMIHCKVSYTACDRPDSTQRAIQKETNGR